MTAAPPELRSAIRDAGLRLRIRRTARAVDRSLPLATTLAVIAVAIGLFGPPVFQHPARAAILAVAAILSVRLAIPFLMRPGIAVSAHALDRESGLPDSVTAALELSPNPGPWASAVVADACSRLRPLPSPAPELRTVGLGLCVVGVLLAVVAVWLPPKSLQAPIPPDPTETVSMDLVEAVVSDWERFSSKTDNPASAALAEAASELRTAMEGNPPGREEALVAIAKVEDRLKAEADSANSHELASALAGSAASVAQALDAGDWKTAAAEAEAMAGAENPSLPTAEQSSAMNALANKLEAAGQNPLARALRAMARASNAEQAAEAMQSFSEALSDAASASQVLELARMQLAATREAMGDAGATPGQDLVPKLPGTDSQPPGSGAGSDSGGSAGENSGTLGELDVLLPLRGTPTSAGESSAEILPSGAPRAESPTVQPTGASPGPGLLSREAIEEENLPLAHRATIRRYFDAIRPQPATP